MTVIWRPLEQEKWLRLSGSINKVVCTGVLDKDKKLYDGLYEVHEEFQRLFLNDEYIHYHLKRIWQLLLLYAKYYMKYYIKKIHRKYSKKFRYKEMLKAEKDCPELTDSLTWQNRKLELIK